MSIVRAQAGSVISPELRHAESSSRRLCNFGVTVALCTLYFGLGCAYYIPTLGWSVWQVNAAGSGHAPTSSAAATSIYFHGAAHVACCLLCVIRPSTF